MKEGRKTREVGKAGRKRKERGNDKEGREMKGINEGRGRHAEGRKELEEGR
jgi:hypothetical protein